MAIEIYNKPTVKYRVEGFALFICNAWELMLKAHLIVRDGEDSIYFTNNPSRTISIDECAARVFTNSKDPLRKNLKRIITLRNTSTHFITQEHELVYAPLFQACVSNYDDKMFALHKINISNLVPANYLYLSMAPSALDPDIIRGKYSVEVAERLLRDANEITQEKIIESSQKYSIVVHTEIAVVKNPDRADFSVRVDKESDIPMRTVNVFKDPRNTHPFSTGNVIDAVNKALDKAGVMIVVQGESKDFNSHHWDLFCKFYGFKSEKEYGYAHQIGRQPSFTYSQKVIDLIVAEIKRNPSGIVEGLRVGLKERS